MAKDNSSTTRVLRRLRKRREDIAQQAFLRSQAQGDMVRSRIERLERELSHRTLEIRQRMLEGGESGVDSAYRLGVDEIRAALSREKAAFAAVTETIQRRRRELMEAMKQRQAVDRVQDKRAGKRKVALRRNEANELDDVHAAHAAARKDG